MYLAIKDKETVYLGITMNRTLYCMSDTDKMSDSNVCVTTFRRCKGVLLAAKKYGVVFDCFKVTDTPLGKGNKEINMSTIQGDIVDTMRLVVKCYGLSSDPDSISTTFCLCTKDKLYDLDISGCVTEPEYSFSNCGDIVNGSMSLTKGLPAEERLIQAFRDIEEQVNCKLFPIRIYDARTCKYKIIKK